MRATKRCPDLNGKALSSTKSLLKYTQCRLPPYRESLVSAVATIRPPSNSSRAEPFNPTLQKTRRGRTWCSRATKYSHPAEPLPADWATHDGAFPAGPPEPEQVRRPLSSPWTFRKAAVPGPGVCVATSPRLQSGQKAMSDGLLASLALPVATAMAVPREVVLVGPSGHAAQPVRDFPRCPVIPPDFPERRGRFVVHHPITLAATTTVALPCGTSMLIRMG